MLDFLRYYGKAKGDQAGVSLIQLLVEWDHKGASKADLLQRGAYLDEIGRQLVKTRREFAEATTKLDARIKENAVNLSAAEDLETQLKSLAPDSPNRAKVQAAFDKLVGIIEAGQPDLEAAKQDHAATQEWLDEREAAHAKAAAGLRDAEGALKRAERDLTRAGETRDRETQRTQEEMRVNGLAVDNSKLDIALNAMKVATQKAQDEAAAQKLKRDALAPAKADHDPILQAALNKAAGKDTEQKSASERLAALKAKAA